MARLEKLFIGEPFYPHEADWLDQDCRFRPAACLHLQGRARRGPEKSMGIDYSAGGEPSTVGAAMAKALEKRALLCGDEEWATHRIRKDFIADEARRGTGMREAERLAVAGDAYTAVAPRMSKR